MQPSDSELIQRAGEGNEDACREIVERYGAYLYRVAYSLVGHAADAEDVVQESLAGAMASLKQFQGRSSLKTWLCAIVVRQSARIHRRRGHRVVVSLDALVGESGNPLETADAANTPDTRMDIREALDALSPEHREVVVLRELQGMSYEEIAAALHVPRGTVESRLFRARHAMRALLKDYLPTAAAQEDDDE